MRKITSLLMLLCMFVGTAWGEVTKFYKPGERLSALVAGSKVMFYNTTFDGTQDRTGFLVDNGSAFGLDKSKPTNSPIFSEKVGVWTVESVEVIETGYSVTIKGTNGYVGIGGATNNAESQVLLVHEWTKADTKKRAGADSENASGEKVANADISAEDKVWLITNSDQSTAWNGNAGSFATWSTGHPYAIYSIVEASEDDLAGVLTVAKTNAVNELNALKTLSEIFTTVESTIDQVENVAIVNSDLESALNTINVLIASVKAEADGKNVKLSNKSADDRGGKFLGYDAANNRAAAIADGGDAAIWTIKTNSDGTFKMYNFTSNLYLGLPDGAGADNAKYTPMHQNAADAPSYTFIPTAENVLALTTGNRMVHIANHSNYKVMNWWDTGDAASLWHVDVVDPIVVTREVYDAALAAKVSLPYAIQQAYGLVTDASCYYSNWKSDAEGSYDALLDNALDTYFHSAYTDAAQDETAETHYIQADLGTTIGEFYFYMAPRTQNGYNRPVNITVSGSNDINGQFTKIADVVTTLDGSNKPYLSDKLGDAESTYQYIRLTVNSTNSGSKFFTLSELYFFPAEGDAEDLVGAYHDFSSISITSPEIVAAANSLINAGGVLALSNIKKEIKSVLDANESNHAATPALGQYTTTAYNALKAAYEASDATQESLETALAAFKASQVVPVYFITSLHDGYAAGSAILYNGTEWRWAEANKYNRQMWMKIPGYTQPNVPVVDAYAADGTNYEICDYPTSTLMRGKKVQIVKIKDWDGAYSLQYNADANSLDAAHHAKNNGQLVNWKPATATDSKASAWYVEYIGTSYELANLTDEKIEALDALKTAYDAKAYYKNVVVGTGLGQYKGDKDAIVAELAKAEAVYVKTLVEQAAMTVEEINAITKSITDVAALTLNMPSAGFYRIASMNSSLHPENKGKFIQSDGGNLKLAETKDVNSILYLDGSNMMISYALGSYLNNYSAPEAKGGAGSAWTFIENAQVIGTYALDNPADKQGGEQYFLSDWTGNVTYGGNDVNAAWMFEEVAELPITISQAGYATFYCPVAVTLPEGLEAYYVGEITNNLAKMTLIEGVIPANTGVILKGNEGPYDLTIATETSVASDETNLLTGIVASAYVEEDSYVLSMQTEGVGFYKAMKNFYNNNGIWTKDTDNTDKGTHFLNNGFKAYLPASVVPSTARFLNFDFGNETAIENIEGAENAANAVIYDLSGRRVQKAQKGLYIVNGVKVIK